MPWCPNCRKEYHEGIEICVDCGCALVNEEPDETVPDVYVDSKARERENRSSAWVLLVAGGIGLIGVTLGITGVLPLRLGNPYLFYGVMSVVFLWFVIMGIISMKSARFFAKKAASEDSLKETVLKWCRENLRAEEIDAIAIDEGTDFPDGVIYFRRVDVLKERINRQFMNLDQNMVDHFIGEQVYDMVFETPQESESP